MRRFVLSIIIILGGFSYSCYQKEIMPPDQTDQQRPVQQRRISNAQFSNARISNAQCSNAGSATFKS